MNSRSVVPSYVVATCVHVFSGTVATEFAVILCGRFEQERSVGAGTAAALRRAYARTGAAVLASGLTAIAGFAVLVASDIQMLRDFGAVTVIHGLKTRSWRYIHTAATALAIGAAAAGRLKDKYAGPSEAPGNK